MHGYNGYSKLDPRVVSRVFNNLLDKVPPRSVHVVLTKHAYGKLSGEIVETGTL